MYLKKNFLSEEPSDWLEQVSSAPLSRLQRLVQLLGGQGVALGNIQLPGGQGVALGNIQLLGGQGVALGNI